jgi:hypothetical protein
MTCRQHRAVRPSGVLLIAFLLAGCQSSGSNEPSKPSDAGPVSPGPGPVNPGDVQRFCEQLLTAVLERVPTCRGGSAEGWKLLSGQFLYGSSGECASLEAAVVAGRLRFDAAAAASCLELVRTAGCQSPAPNPSPCLRVYQGLVAPGGTCRRTHNECADGFCEIEGGDGCQGTCQALPRIGQPCGAYQFCAGDAYCKMGTCAARVHAGVGEPCTAGQCQDGVFGEVLHCKMGSGDSGRCEALLPAGASCSDDPQCQAGLHCPFSTRICTRGVPAGGSCTWGEGECAEPGACHTLPGMTTGTCREGAAPDGTTCAGFGPDLVICAGYCDTPGIEDGVCRSEKMLGDNCMLHDECPGRCDPLTHTCVAACAP